MLLVAIAVAIVSHTARALADGAAPRLPRAMWLWDPNPLLGDANQRREFLDFCDRQDVAVVWMQVSTLAADGGSAGRRLNREDDWRALLAEAHARRIRIHALDGDPRFALKTFHEIPLGTVDAIIDFNARGRKEERFDGVHFDNEPYLLRGWGHPVTRERILREFLELNAEIQRRIRDRSAMEYGIDIPFWWQYTNARTGRPHGDVAFNGKRQAASYHVIELLDNVGIMNYRNYADGTDGLIAHGRDLLAFADHAKRARLWMGVETSRSKPVDVWFVLGLGATRADETVGELLDDQQSERFQGFRVRRFDDGSNLHIGLELPDGRGAERESPRSALVELAKRYGVTDGPDTGERIDDAQRRAFRALREDGEWLDMQDGPIQVGGALFAGFLATRGMLPKLTFDGKPIDEMDRELRHAEAVFGSFKRYAGFAIHHYETYRAKFD